MKMEIQGSLRISKWNQAWGLLNLGPHVTFQIAGYKIKELFTPASAVTCGLWQGLPEEGGRQCDVNGSRLWNRETCILAPSLVFHLGPWSLWPFCEGLLSSDHPTFMMPALSVPSCVEIHRIWRCLGTREERATNPGGTLWVSDPPAGIEGQKLCRSK